MKVFNNIGSNNNIQNAYSELVKVCLSKRAPIKKVKTEYWLTKDLFVKNGQVQLERRRNESTSYSSPLQTVYPDSQKSEDKKEYATNFKID